MTAARRSRRATMPVGDAALEARTGRDWSQWCAALDRTGAKRMTHGEIAAMLHRKFGVGPWWTQMVTVGYERARGLRAVHQTAAGFRAQVSRTIAAPARSAFRHWREPNARRRWLPSARMTVRTAIAPRSLRITWPDGTDVLVGIIAKGTRKCIVAVEHGKITSAAGVRRAKSYWAARLDALRDTLEG
jgi:hypothetical protein